MNRLRPLALLALCCTVIGCGKNTTAPTSKPDSLVPALVEASKSKDVNKLADLFDEPYASCYKSAQELKDAYARYDKVEQSFLNKAAREKTGMSQRVANFTPLNYDWFTLGEFKLDKVEEISPTKFELHGTAPVEGMTLGAGPLTGVRPEYVRKPTNFTAVWKGTAWKLIPWGRLAAHSTTLRPFPVTEADTKHEIPVEQVEKQQKIIAAILLGLSQLEQDIQAGKFKSPKQLVDAKAKMFEDACASVGETMQSRNAAPQRLEKAR